MPLVIVVVSYALGCLSPGYLLVRRATGADLRDTHTGSTGARNAGRVAGAHVAAAVFLLDLAKGAAAVLLARAAGIGEAGETAALVAVVAGHVLPVQLRFRGGRGLSTALGAILVLSPPVALGGLAVAAVTLAVARSFTAAGLAAALAAPVVAGLAGEPGVVVVGIAVASALIAFAHTRRDGGGGKEVPSAAS